jgi:hypothetical protein
MKDSRGPLSPNVTADERRLTPTGTPSPDSEFNPRSSAFIGGSNPYIEPTDPRQIEILRRMTGQQRLRIGFEITDFALKLATAGIRHQYPGISEEGLKKKLQERLRL